MRQVVQPAGGGPVVVVDAPAPQLTTVNILVETAATVISAGTERAATQLAQASLASKARARPDLVRQVVAKARTDGVRATVQSVRSRLADDLALGYSGAGTVLEVGTAASRFRPGDRVATAGGGFASHAELQSVPWTLAAPIPDSVADEHAAFATIAAVGLHGLRLGGAGIGSRIVVVGLGLIGQLTARMALGSGCRVFGVDLDEELVALATAHGADGAIERGDDTTSAILDWSHGRGADVVILTAGARGDSSIIGAVPERSRDRATVVAVGDVGLDIDRNAFYHRELDLKVARSYGPGRYDRSYEEWGVDYPIGYVRWTEGRNLEAVIDLLATDRLAVDDLVSHRFDIADAADAYTALETARPRPLGIVLKYPGDASPRSTVAVHPTSGRRAVSRSPRVGILGAGNFVRGVIIPALTASGSGPVVHVASSSGVSATRLAERKRIERASSDPAAVIGDPETEVVVVATPHSTHAELTAAALRAGKDVYVEKPLAIDWSGLEEVERALEETDGRLYVGFNRRYAPMVTAARSHLAGSGPLQIEYRVNAGPLPSGHWYADRREGGRLLGEVCHFVDTCGYLVGDADVASVDAVAPAAEGHDSYHLLIGYADGSSASIVYSAGSHPSTPKERIEVNGRGHTVVVDNFRTLTVDGRRVRVDGGKGHAEGIADFVAGRTDPAATAARVTTKVTLVALDRLTGTGG